MPALKNLLGRVIKYQKQLQPAMAQQLKAYKEKPEPKAVVYSCMDSRVSLTKMLDTDVGDMFMVRNAGNMLPHANRFSFESASTEPGALEVGCVMNGIRHVLVCGHSDCKAMIALYGMRDSMDDTGGTPLQQYIRRHGVDSVKKFKQLEASGGVGPLTFQTALPNKTFQAYIDPQNQFGNEDKLSLINTLQQLENLASFPIMKEKQAENKVRMNAMWFDVNSGGFLMFSREKETFIPIDESSIEHLAEE